LGAIAAAQAFGAANIVATDIVPSRMELGQQMGATHVLHGVQDDVGVLVRELTQGVGADAVIECSGNIPALQAAFKYLRKGGRVVLVGLPSQPLTLDVGPDLAFKEATVRGVHGRRMYETWQTMESLLVKGLIDPKPIITHVLPMAEYEDGIHLCKSGEGCKVLLLPK
jgi:threonine 3-dehydrogenase